MGSGKKWGRMARSGRGRVLLAVVVVVCASAPLMMGAGGGGCAANSSSDVPDVSGTWDMTYDDSLAVRVTIGGAVYDQGLGATGGMVTIDHMGQPIQFNVDCASPAIVCPSEQWPASVEVTQPQPNFPHRMWVTLPGQTCSGTLMDPDPAACGEGTLNPNCEQVCDGDLLQGSRNVFGVINEPGDHFDLLLGAGVATNGLNCALLGVSSANADLSTTGSAATSDWVATTMDNGQVVVAYAGGCLWVADPTMTGDLRAAVLSASLELRTGFTGTKR